MQVTMTSVGTPLYCAPEIARGDNYDEKVDVYSFGLVLLAMTVRGPLLDFIGQRWCVDNGKSSPPKNVMRLITAMQSGWRPVTVSSPVPATPSSINALIIKCCIEDPAGRPTFSEILTELGGSCESEISDADFKRFDADAHFEAPRDSISPPPPLISLTQTPMIELATTSIGSSDESWSTINVNRLSIPR